MDDTKLAKVLHEDDDATAILNPIVIELQVRKLLLFISYLINY